MKAESVYFWDRWNTNFKTSQNVRKLDDLVKNVRLAAFSLQKEGRQDFLFVFIRIFGEKETS